MRVKRRGFNWARGRWRREAAPHRFPALEDEVAFIECGGVIGDNPELPRTEADQHILNILRNIEIDDPVSVSEVCVGQSAPTSQGALFSNTAHARKIEK